MKFNGEYLDELLIHYTAANSSFEESRNYISLSHAALPTEEIVRQYFEGFKADEEARLRCHKGYQMERDIKDRLRQVCDIHGLHFQENVEISAYDGLVKGHPDFKIDGYLGDIKSLPLDAHIPKRPSEVSRKVFFQIQAYLLYSGEQQAVVLYESRETGWIGEIWLKADPHGIQRQIRLKYEEVVKQVKARIIKNIS